MVKVRIIKQGIDNWDTDTAILDFKQLENHTNSEEYYLSGLDDGEKRFVDAHSGGKDRDGKDIFVSDKLSIVGSSTIYVVEFDEVNLRYLGIADDGCTLLGCQFDVSKIEGNVHNEKN